MSDTAPPASQAIPVPRRRRSPSARQVGESNANRRAILLRAVEFFARNGYTKTTLQAVAESVDLTRTGILHHFGSKEALFLRSIEECRRWADEQVQGPTGLRGMAGIRALSTFLGSDEDKVWIMFAQMLQGEALHNDAPEPLVDFVRQRVGQVHQNLEARLREAQEDGDIPDVDTAALARTMAGAINGLQIQWLLDPSVDTSAALAALCDGLTRAQSDSRDITD